MDKLLSQQVTIEQKIPHGWQLKILMLSWEYPPNVVGGLSRHVFGLSVQLAALGHEVHVLTAGKDDLSSFEKINGVYVHRVKPLNEQDEQFFSWIGGLNLAFGFKAEKLAEEIKFDLIHAHDWLVGSTAIALKQLWSIPLLSTIHATEHGRNNGIHTELQKLIDNKEKQLISETDQIIVCSEYMKEELITNFCTAKEKIAVIPNGVERSSVTLSPLEIVPEIRAKKYVFSIGRIVKEKGFETMIEAATIAKEKRLSLYFVIAGKGPMLETYRRRVVERQLEDYITFIGYITEEQRTAFIYKSEMAVFPSLYEPFGIVALESMILGKPTIVSDTGGLKGIVKHLNTGMLMIPGDAKNLLEQVTFLIQNPEKAKAIGQKGRQIIKSLYGWNRIAKETSRIMEDTLLNRRVNNEELKK